jgi:hypothetical protein
MGPKMAFLHLHAAWDMWVLPFSESSCDCPHIDGDLGQKCGIGLDVYMHHITHRLKWHKPPTKIPGERVTSDHSFIGHLAPFSLSSSSVG